MRDVKHFWDACSDSLQQQVTAGVWRSTFQGIHPVFADDSRLVLSVPNGTVADRLHGPYKSMVNETIESVNGAPLDLVVEVHPETDPGAAAVEIDEGRLPDDNEDPIEVVAPVLGVSLSDPATATAVDPLYTFDDFVIGPSNRFSYAASMAVAETPGKAYNPLFIYGDAGLGKTHLLQAIRAYMIQNYPGKVVRYVSAESFLNQFVECIRLKTMNEFKTLYREIDVLLVDDIQFIEGAERFQEEFFHTFNELHARRSQIVLTSDRAPDAISTLEHRLRSRFRMGLITDIQPPDIETRLAILLKKAERCPIEVPDDVLEFIATNITDNIRELEGALTRVTAYANLYGRELGVSMAEQVLSDILIDRQSRSVSVSMILDMVSQRYGLSIDEITGKSRRRPLVIARQVAMYVIRELTDLSYPAIAKEFSDRDHTTVMHAVTKIEALMAERKAIFHQVQAIIQELRKGTP